MIVMKGEESAAEEQGISTCSKQYKRTTTIKRANQLWHFPALDTDSDCSNSFPFMILFTIHTLKLSHVFNKMETGSEIWK